MKMKLTKLYPTKAYYFTVITNTITNKNDLIISYSHHVNKITSGILIDFLRALEYVVLNIYMKKRNMNSNTTLYISHLIKKEKPTEYTITRPIKRKII